MSPELEKLWKSQPPAAWAIEGATGLALLVYYVYSRSKAQSSQLTTSNALQLPNGVTPADLAGLPFAYDNLGGSLATDSSSSGPSGGSTSTPLPSSGGSSSGPSSPPVSTGHPPVNNPQPTGVPRTGVTQQQQKPINGGSLPGQGNAKKQTVFPDAKGTPGESNKFWVFTTDGNESIDDLNKKAGWAQYGDSYVYNYRNNAKIFQSLGLPDNNTGWYRHLPAGIEVSL